MTAGVFTLTRQGLGESISGKDFEIGRFIQISKLIIMIFSKLIIMIYAV